MESLPIRLRPRLRKVVVLLLGAIVFVAGGIWMVPEKPLIGYSLVIFFGLCAVVFAIQFHPKSSYLILSAEGFTFASLFRRSFVPWTSVEGFMPISISLNELVGWNYSPEYWAHARMRKINTAISGAEAALPDTYGMRAEELAAMMNRLRSKYGQSAP